MMTKAIRIHENGGPDVMRFEDIELPPPGAGEVRLRHTAIGVNYSDVNVRRGGFYLSKIELPTVLGNEAAGVVESVGPGVTSVKPGDRVVYAGMRGEFIATPGAYAQARNAQADRLVKIPDGVTDRQAAAMMLKGLTASLMINRLYKPQPGDAVLIHTAAGGVGMILAQWSKHLGATVIGTVGSPEKARAARAHGCDHPILYRETDFVAAVNALAPQGVAAVYDGVGKDTFMASLPCVRPYGLMVNFGNASGAVPPIDIRVLSPKSVSVVRCGVGNYVSDGDVLQTAAAELFELVRTGALDIGISKTYPLAEAHKAHEDIEARRNAGSILLVP